MDSPRVLRLPLGDKTDEFILVHVESAGRETLDIGLIATEGTGRWVASLQHDRISSLRVKNSPLSESEWQSILESVLSQEALPYIQTKAVIQAGNELSITIRKQIQGITQRLGSIALKYDMSEDIQLFYWCGIAAQASADRSAALARQAIATQCLEQSIHDLNRQLDELIRAKQEDETVLLSRFRDLLNEKKVKIREQQKLLAAASFDGGISISSQQVPRMPSPQSRRAPKLSRPSKRKASATKESEDEGFEKMQIKNEDTDPGITSESTASTARDEEKDDDDERQVKSTAGAAVRSESRTSTDGPPPRRDLPFLGKQQTSWKSTKEVDPTSIPAETGEETESDDEL